MSHKREAWLVFHLSRFSGSPSTLRGACECGGLQHGWVSLLYVQPVPAAEPVCWLERGWQLSYLQMKVLLLSSIMQWHVWLHTPSADLFPCHKADLWYTLRYRVISIFLLFFCKDYVSSLHIHLFCICMTHSLLLKLQLLSVNLLFQGACRGHDPTTLCSLTMLIVFTEFFIFISLGCQKSCMKRDLQPTYTVPSLRSYTVCTLDGHFWAFVHILVWI